eukprot:6344323-Prymnesium_polylepis.1
MGCGGARLGGGGGADGPALAPQWLARLALLPSVSVALKTNPICRPNFTRRNGVISRQRRRSKLARGEQIQGCAPNSVMPL